MSAGPAPANPGTPRSGPKPPAASTLRRFSPQILLGGVAVGVAYAFLATRAPKPQGTPTMNPLRTPGVQNIEKAYSNGGGTATHQPAYGGTKLGDNSQHLREGGASGRKEGFKDDGIGEEQRPVQPNATGKMFNDMKYGSEKGK